MITDSTEPGLSHPEQLLKRCVTMIQETNKNEGLTPEEQKNIITKCLHILKLMIEESEKRGTARIKSHSGLLKRKILNLKATWGFSNNAKEAKLKVFGNTTVWELKEIISKKFNYCVDFLRVTIHNGYELKNSDNGKTILEMQVKIFRFIFNS